jgi:transposase, IS6 family
VRRSTSFFRPGATPWPPSAFRAKALGGDNHPAPRVINTDKHPGYPPAIVELKADGLLEVNCEHRPVQYLNNVLEQDHRA